MFNRKLILIFTLLYIMLLIFSVPSLAAEKDEAIFSDVPETHWASSNIKALFEKKWINGYPDGTFHPDQKVSRAEIAALIARAAGSSAPLPETPTFYDVSKNDWFSSPIEITKAFFTNDSSLKSGLFRPGDFTTRQEASSAIALARGYGGGSDPGDLGRTFKDYDSIAPEYRSVILSAVEKGLVKGYTDGSFYPAGFLTRAEAAAIIFNAFYTPAAVDLTMEGIINSGYLKAFSQSLDKFKDTKELLDSQLGDLGGITLKYYIKETKLGGENSDSVIYIFARVDPFKYFSFTDTIFATEPARVKNFSEKIVAAASPKYPAQTIIAVIGFTNLAFYSTVPDIYGEDYTQYSKNEGGWRVERLYAAARGMDGKITDTWLEAGRAS
ncbi:MAG: S-layer homology domain-containing protein [Desulfocucumaceae bacterium]